MSIQQTFDANEIWEPLYQLRMRAFDWEIQLFNSKALRRLKHLHHFGASSLFSPVVHSRFEHTLGVWSLAATFFPEDHELRAAAILHDVGHLPFSHAVEETLQFNHHANTETIIHSGEVASIIEKYHLNRDGILERIIEQSPLTSSTEFLGLDHLDSFFRDTYMAGRVDHLPANMIKKVKFSGNFVETDKQTALELVQLIVNDHEMFLDPRFLAMDKLLSEAIVLFCNEIGGRHVVETLVDFEVLHFMKNSNIPKVKEIMEVLLYEPYRIRVSEHNQTQDNHGMEIEVRKLYIKTPLVDGTPITEIDARAKEKLDALNHLKKTYIVAY